MELNEWVRSQLPQPGARILEVGCGAGELARALDDAGYDVLAIDPVAPGGRIFRRTTIEELDDTHSFDAVVASRALHHVADLDTVFEKLARLAPLLVVDEFAWDQLDEPTARWYEQQRRDAEAPPISEWQRRHGHLHGFRALRDAVARRYVERAFAWTPYIHRYIHRPELEPLERELIAAGAIRALGFRIVAERRD